MRVNRHVAGNTLDEGGIRRQVSCEDRVQLNGCWFQVGVPMAIEIVTMARGVWR